MKRIEKVSKKSVIKHNSADRGEMGFDTSIN
jgi:hypothetical protein